ncbi:MAG: hypothetical protein AUK34_05905 [Ignavibacteria bacterium CG2_30_36_16]|nr:MAG: hypothetical protein AUK34_05905 [Ignavibacteria bacterium CG2_30_36_16]PJB01946.1 MAG: hypothetical protein CO127_01250 [Ignavibacteria bacterium CG_4_9_14_3_um_filter_36_18]
MFPRELYNSEKEILFYLLPEKKPGYNCYRKKISAMFVIGNGRFGDTNKIIGSAESTIDLSAASTPVFALGTIYEPGKKIDVLIHEEMDGQIEFDISEKKDASIIRNSVWSYSQWQPGSKAPGDNADVREIIILNDLYTLAIATSHKKLWLHSSETGVNHIIPVTNFYNYLMLVKNIRETKIVLKPDLFFINQKNYQDNELKSAFILYNKYFKRVKIKEDLTQTVENRKPQKSIFGFLKRGLN